MHPDLGAGAQAYEMPEEEWGEGEDCDVIGRMGDCVCPVSRINQKQNKDISHIYQ